MSGWIKLHRELKNNSIFENEKLLKIFIWCLLKATHKPRRQLIGKQFVDLEPGQFPTGRIKAGEELSMPPSTAWDYLKLLEENGSISINSNNKFSVITVGNWKSYQLEDEKSDNKITSNEQQIDNRLTTDGQHLDTNKNVKNVKNVKNKDIMDYKSVYDYYLTLDLVKHRKYTNDISKAITKAVKDNKYDIDYCKLLLDRHKQVVEITKKNEKPVRVRGLTQFFGQKAYNATHLICSEYEEGGKLYETHLRNRKEVKEREPLTMVIRDDY